jgi:hypothetical protein
MTAGTGPVAEAPPAAAQFTAKLAAWYYDLNPTYRTAFRWVLIIVSTMVAFRQSLLSLMHTSSSQGLGGYVWTVFVVAAMSATAVTRRERNELPIHDRQTDVIVGGMGLVLALLVQSILLQRFAMYFHLLRLDLVAMWLFMFSSCVVLFGLRPATRFWRVWALLFMVFPLPYYLWVIAMGGSSFAAGVGTLLIAGFGVGVAVNRTRSRGYYGAIGAWVVGFAILVAMHVLYPDAPLRLYQGIPAVTAVAVVSLGMYLAARRGAPKRILERSVEPLAAKQVWAGVPLVIGVALVLAFIPLPAQADTSVIERTAPGALTFGQPVVAPRGWNTLARQNFREVHRFYGPDAVMVRQEMTAEVGDPRFDQLSRPRTAMVDSIVTERPFTFEVYPSRVAYDMTGARLSPLRDVDLGYGVTGQMVSVVDDNLLITWNSLRFAWGDGDLAQRITIFAVDNHDAGAPFPEPSKSLLSTLRTLFTLLFRGNAVFDERTPTFKDAEFLTEFGRALVAAQFRPSGEAG